MGASLLTLFVASATQPPFNDSCPKGLLFPLGIQTILIAHIMFNISYVVVTVKARLAGFDRRLEEAAMDLGANEMGHVLEGDVPADPAGHRGGGAAGLQLSIDDFIITNLVSGRRRTRSRSGSTRSRRTRCRSRSTSSARSCSSARCAFVAVSNIVTARRARAADRRRATAADRSPARRSRPAAHGGRSPARPRRSCRRSGAGSRTSTVDRGEGSWLITTDGERYLDYTLGDRRHEHRPRPSAGRRGDRGAGREAPPRPAEHRLPRARPAPVRAAPARPARRRLGRRSCRTAAPRRSRRPSSSPGSRPAGR